MDVDFAILFTFVCSATIPLDLVSAFTKCEKVDACKYKTNEGELSLWSLARNADVAPRFSDIKDNQGRNLLYYWNPCIPWTPKDVKGCSSIAAYAQSGVSCISLGKQDSAKFSLDSSGNCVLSYNATLFSSPTHLNIILKCDDNSEATVEPVTSDVKIRHFNTTLHSKYNCIQGGLSTGTILVIIFICLVVVYLVGGILFNKFSKGATGKELLPNLSFWEDFPSLVKDGFEFTLKSARNLCCKQDGYESI